MSATTEDVQQETLFDLSGKEYNAYWVDEKAPLFVPNNPLHWKAHKLQILVSRLEVQAQKNPAQFNSKNYIDALSELEKLLTDISKRGDNESMDSRNLVGSRDEGTTSLDGQVEPISMDS